MRLRRLFPIMLLLLLMGAGVAQSAAPGNLSAEEARRLLASDPRIFLLDVRTPEEFRQVRLQGARLVPIDQLSRRMGEIPKDRPVLVYCAVGSRSSQAANYLSRQGYRVFNLFGGIYAWQLRGYPVLQGGP